MLGSIDIQAANADDIWIYLDKSGGFTDYSSVVTGAIWGSDQSGQGRVDSVVSSSPGPAWSSTTDFIDTSSLLAGQTIQLNPTETTANTSSNWIVAASNLGSFTPVPEPTTLSVTLLGCLTLVSRRRRVRAL